MKSIWHKLSRRGTTSGGNMASSRKTFQPQVEDLESRLALASNTLLSSSMAIYSPPASGIYYNSLSKEITVHGTSGADKVEVTQSSFSPDINTPPIVMTQVKLNGQTQLFMGSPLKINFFGYNGNDEFRNYTSIASVAKGGYGNDLLIGGGGQDQLYGDAGNDELHGKGGNDGLHGGNDNDLLYAGAGSDSLEGDAGDDTLICIGGGTDTVTGGTGNDSFWMDTVDVILDASAWEISHRHVHAVSQFMSYTIDGGAPIAVSKELNGQSLADPLHIVPEVEEGETPPVFTKMNYADNPLFAIAGPSKDDIDQGKVGDCYFVATLSAIADADPDFIRQMVVDLGDGTYAVRFYNYGEEVYVRVDADLWLQDGVIAYAGLGVGGSLWAPIVEKAYAFFRKGKGTYASIAGGNGTVDEHLNVGQTKWEINDGVTPEQTIAWYNSGSPAGAFKDQIKASVTELLNWIQDQFDAGRAVTTGARSNVGNNSAISLDDPNTDANENTYRRGQHVYMVDNVLYDANGNPYGMRLRNPYGSYLNITDLAHLHFCIGRAVAWDLAPPLDLVYDGGFVFEEVFVSPIGPVSQTDLARSAATIEAAQSLALETYQSRTWASDAMVRSIAKKTSSSWLSPFETEWEF